jgi:transcription elongation factor GreB
MGRYRPPAPKSSPYITREGFVALQEELRGLWIRRREVTKALSAAAAEGDRSENAEYIYRKKELAGIDRRIRYLQRRLPVLKVVSEPPTDRQRVFFGASVTLEDDNGDTVTYRIVGADEFSTRKGWISMDAPLARAVMKRALHDEISVQLPEGTRHFCIVAVAYECS